MSNVVNDFTFQNYSANQQYRKHDVVYGVNASDINFYYATQDVIGVSPRAPVSYSGLSWSRTDDLATINFTKTGSQPDFTAGTMISIVATGATSLNFTGIALEGGANYVKFLNPGLDQALSGIPNVGVVTAILSPAWTTGFFWAPSNSTNVNFQTNRDFAQFGDGYTQQARQGINSIGSKINLMFENRSYKESRAILNFVQVAGGVNPITINLPVNRLFNNPNTKYLLTDPDIKLKSFDLNDISLMATRVYNP